jgi:hypothetical protein
LGQVLRPYPITARFHYIYSEDSVVLKKYLLQRNGMAAIPKKKKESYNSKLLSSPNQAILKS